jgi:hypothetical protein
MLHLVDQRGAARSGECAVAQIEAEFAAVLADQVQNGENGLAVCAPKPAPKLLKEDCCALSGSKQQDSVDLGQVKTFIEEVSRKQALDIPSAELLECPRAVIRPCLARDCRRWDASVSEDPSHVLRVRDRHAESQGSHGPDIRDLVGKFAKHLGSSGVIPCVNAVETRNVVRAAFPLDPCQVDVVGNAEVVEGHEEIRGQGIPESQFVRGASVEEGPDVDSIRAFRCRGQTK